MTVPSASKDGVTATAEVVRGGNQRLAVRVPVLIRDVRGHVWWEGEAVAHVDIPAGAPIPEVEVPLALLRPIILEVPGDG